VLKSLSEPSFISGHYDSDYFDTCSFQVSDLCEAATLTIACLELMLSTLLAVKEIEFRSELIAENAAWLLDSCSCLQPLLHRYPKELQLQEVRLLSMVCRLVSEMKNAIGVAAYLRKKGFFALVLCSTATAKQIAHSRRKVPDHIVKVLATALIEIAGCCAQSTAVQELVESDLLGPLEKLASQPEPLSFSPDFLVCTPLSFFYCVHANR
jgi:hypothetical protein